MVQCLAFASPVALEGEKFDLKSFAQIAVILFCGASFALFWTLVGMQLQHGPFILRSIASKVVIVC